MGMKIEAIKSETFLGKFPERTHGERLAQHLPPESEAIAIVAVSLSLSVGPRPSSEALDRSPFFLPQTALHPPPSLLTDYDKNLFPDVCGVF